MSERSLHEAACQQNRKHGVDLVIVPVHSIACPLYAPYQGWVISMSNQGGYTTDANGARVPVHPVRDTSYGEPAGLWGINCSHQPDPFIPGWSESERPIKHSEVSARYEQTQKQRYHEQQVKKWKRSAMAAEASGDTEAFRQAAAKVKEKQAALKAYCEKTGLPYSGDTAQVFGYNKRVAGKASASTTEARLQKALANAEIRLPNGSVSRLTPGTLVSDISTFAGKGATTDLRVKQFLVDKYGGAAENWQHSKGRGYVGSGAQKAMLHWFYEESVGVRELFVKGWSKK